LPPIVAASSCFVLACFLEVRLVLFASVTTVFRP
jgi:hypothetical protein